MERIYFQVQLKTSTKDAVPVWDDVGEPFNYQKTAAALLKYYERLDYDVRLVRRKEGEVTWTVVE